MKTVPFVIAPDSIDEVLDPTPITAARGKRVPEPTAAARMARLALRAWERRLRRSGLAVIAASFPIAFLLFTHAEAHPVAIRVALWIWIAAVSTALVCAEAVWRHRFRLENGYVGRDTRIAGPAA
jgi:hypothetical protein